jgi:ribosomal protein S18 acetylase RimI-like enzyme
MIRAARPDDLSAIEAIIAASFALYVPRMDRPPGPMLDDYAAHVAAGRATVFEQDGRVVGLAVLTPDADHALLDVVAVDPACQGRGIGPKLMAHAEQVARGLGYREIRLYTNEAMTENLPLYRRLGYEETHRAVENGYRRIHMRKPL